LVHRLSCVDGAVLSDAKFEQTLAQRDGRAPVPGPTSVADRAVRWPLRDARVSKDPEFTDETATAESER
jgi:hypothetical protein